MSESADRPATLIRGQFDPSDRTEPTATIVELLAHVEGVSPLAVTPLYESVDPDALNRLFDHDSRTTGATSPTLEFDADGRGVVVDGDGEVRVLAAD